MQQDGPRGAGTLPGFHQVRGTRWKTACVFLTQQFFSHQRLLHSLFVYGICLTSGRVGYVKVPLSICPLFPQTDAGEAARCHAQDEDDALRRGQGQGCGPREVRLGEAVLALRAQEQRHGRALFGPQGGPRRRVFLLESGMICRTAEPDRVVR